MCCFLFDEFAQGTRTRFPNREALSSIRIRRRLCAEALVLRCDTYNLDNRFGLDAKIPGLGDDGHRARNGPDLLLLRQQRLYACYREQACEAPAFPTGQHSIAAPPNAHPRAHGGGAWRAFVSERIHNTDSPHCNDLSARGRRAAELYRLIEERGGGEWERYHRKGRLATGAYAVVGAFFCKLTKYS